MKDHKITAMKIKRKNQNLIFRCLRKLGTVSNPDLAYELNLSLPTVTQNTRELIRKCLVKETGEMEAAGGKKLAQAIKDRWRFQMWGAVVYL